MALARRTARQCLPPHIPARPHTASLARTARPVRPVAPGAAPDVPAPMQPGAPTQRATGPPACPTSSPLLKVPFLYPVLGLGYLFLHWDIGLKARGEQGVGRRRREGGGGKGGCSGWPACAPRGRRPLFPGPAHARHPAPPLPSLLAAAYAVLEVCVPLYWVSHRLVDRHHRRVFEATFSRRLGLSRATAAPLAPGPAAALAAQAATIPAGGHAPPAARHPALAALLWAARGPSPGSPFYSRWAHNALAAPIGLAFPALPRLLAVRDTRDLGAGALAPYLRMKGVTGKAEAAVVGRANAAACRAFGAAAFVFGCVPLVSWLLTMATAAGAGMWAADLEAAGGRLV